MNHHLWIVSRSERALRVCAASVLLALGGVLSVGHAQAADQNLEGVWKLASKSSGLRPADGAELPFTAEGRSQYEANQAAAAKGDFSFDPTESRCSSPGLPRIMLMQEPLKIYVRPRVVTMLFQWNRIFRQIDMRPASEEKPANPMGSMSDVGSMMGSSSGQWQGKTLVVKSTGFSPQRLLDDRIPNSESLAVEERLSLRDRDTLQNEVTIEDPAIFTRPWQALLLYKRQPDDLFPFPEDVCLDRKQIDLMVR